MVNNRYYYYDHVGKGEIMGSERRYEKWESGELLVLPVIDHRIRIREWTSRRIVDGTIGSETQRRQDPIRWRTGSYATSRLERKVQVQSYRGKGIELVDGGKCEPEPK